ncbi:1-acyl-sn-glycerol-3-phosphate acyltransferase LPAT1, chloroplastic-like protein [Drosera capensis]
MMELLRPSILFQVPRRIPVGVDLTSNARGLCFYMVVAVLAICCMGPMLLVHPFVLIADPYRRGFQHLVARTWSTPTILAFIKVEYEGLENLPTPDTPSYSVYVVMYKCQETVSVLAYSSRFVLLVQDTAGRDGYEACDLFCECLKRCMNLINRGASVFFFPEATRSKDGRLGTFKKGAFSVAVKTGVPVVPITISGTGNIMPSGKEGILNYGAVKVVVHKGLTGTDAEVLCREARSVIADTLDRCAD